jgi:hypothetical protein
MLPKNRYYTFFGGIGFPTQDFELVKQELSFFSHTSSSHLSDDLEFENTLFCQFSIVTHLFLQQLTLFIVKERMKIEYYLQTVSHVH